VSVQQFHNMIEWIRINDRMRKRYELFKKAAAFKPTGPMNRSMTSVATPILDQFSEDLTTAGVRGHLPLLVGREREIEEVFRVIEGGGQSAVLVGPEGVGKTTVLMGIAQLMVEERVPKILQDKRLVRLSVPHLISGVDPSMAQERMLRLFYEVSKSRNIILAVTDLEQMTGVSSGNDATADLAATFVDFLSRGGTFAIATATSQAYVSSIERSVLGRVFQKVDIHEPDETHAIHMLQSKIGEIEYTQKVIFSYGAVEKAVQLSDRYMHEAYLPKKAITVAREAALLVSKNRGEDALVTAEDIAQIVTEKTGVKATRVESEEKETLLNLEERMHGRVIGQEEAVKAVASALRRARAELSSQDRPLATFLFLGPTGVGKTELAKTVAQMYFGSESAMIRLDMSEYQAQDSIQRLLGAPGSNQGGLLTEAVRKQPFAIVLLDELEKAHPEILNVFLQVFDDGRLTDASGRTIDFTNTIIISTSNAGTQYIQDAVGRGEALADIKTHLIEEELKGVYRPEFLNRFDGVIVFKPLTQDEVFQITGLMIGQVAKRLEPKGIFFRAEPEAIKELSEKGYDPKFGARPLRRVIQEEVDNAIADALLAGKVKRRDTIVLKAGGSIEIEEGKTL
jgi:ATP-dependent Clp protease ATP-binding subunit ClpC